MKTSQCRKCHTIKAQGDPCPSCGAGLPSQCWQGRRGTQMAFTKDHGFHAPTPQAA